MFTKKKILTYEDSSSKLECMRSALKATPNVTVGIEQLLKKEETYYQKELLKFEYEENITYSINGSVFNHSIVTYYYPDRKREIYNIISTGKTNTGPIPTEIQSVVDEVTANVKKYCGVPIKEETTGKLK